VLQKSFVAWDANSLSRRRGDRVKMWGTTQSCAKLTGDSRNGFEVALSSDCRLFRPLAGNQPQRLLRLLQHYRHRTDLPTLLRDVCYWGQSRKHLLLASISHFDPFRTFRSGSRYVLLFACYQVTQHNASITQQVNPPPACLREEARFSPCALRCQSAHPRTHEGRPRSSTA
jgi:hypothetical protein